MIKTVTLETAKKLKDAGFRQDTYFNWLEMITEQGGILRLIPQESLANKYSDISNYYAAPTTDELLEDITEEGMLQYYTRLIPNGETIGDLKVFTMDILALFRDPNKLADCWLWLKREGLI